VSQGHEFAGGKEPKHLVSEVVFSENASPGLCAGGLLSLRAFLCLLWAGSPSLLHPVAHVLCAPVEPGPVQVAALGVWTEASRCMREPYKHALPGPTREGSREGSREGTSCVALLSLY
jgi:hypothetical protein